MPGINYKLVRELVPMSCIVRGLELRPNMKGMATCPRCKRPKLHISGKAWFCHRCGRGGNQLDLLAFAEGLTLYAAAERACGLAGVEVPLVTQW